MKVSPFSIKVCRDGNRYIAVARTIAGDRTAYGSTHLQAFCRVLRVAWQVSEDELIDINGVAGVLERKYMGDTDPEGGSHEYTVVHNFLSETDAEAYKHAQEVYNAYGQDGAWALSRATRIATEQGLES